MHRTDLAKIRALVGTWLVLDFFGEARRTGGTASTLTTTIFSQSFLAFVVAALLYPEPEPVPFAAANLCLSTLLVLLGSLDDEGPQANRLADRVLLSTAPVSGLTVALARAGHAAFQTLLLTVGMALPPAILLGCRQGQVVLVPAYLLAACISTVLATGTMALLLRASRRWFGSARTALLAGTGKALLLGFGVALFVLSLPALQRDATALPFGRLGAELLPPYHLARLLADPVGDAWRLLPILGLGALLLLANAWVGERERESGDRLARDPMQGPLRAMLRPGPETAVGLFAAAMLWRSPGLRARVLPLLGLPAAVAFLSLQGEDGRGRALFLAMALQFPAIYLPFVIAFLPRADHPGARWVFDSAPELPIDSVRRATWAALVTHLLLPVQALLLLALLAAGVGPGQAVPAVLFALATGVVAARTMVGELTGIPFTREADRDEELQFGNLLASGIALAAVGAAHALLPTLPGLALLLLASAVALWLCRRPR